MKTKPKTNRRIKKEVYKLLDLLIVNTLRKNKLNNTKEVYNILLDIESNSYCKARVIKNMIHKEIINRNKLTG